MKYLKFGNLFLVLGVFLFLLYFRGVLFFSFLFLYSLGLPDRKESDIGGKDREVRGG